MASPTPQARLDFEAVTEREQFRTLKRTHRGFVFPLTAVFLVWYFLYVLLAAYAHDFMATPVFGEVNVGILLGLGQFVSTFVITMVYVAFANRRLDPIASDIRADLEAAER